MEAAPDVVHLALEGGRLVQSARGPPTPRPQYQSSCSQGLTTSAESVLHPPSGSWVQTAEGASVELVPGGGGMLRVTAQLQRADGSWRAAAVEYDEGDELNNRDGSFTHSIYHIGGEACCGLGDRGRERRGMPTGERAACADCALRILRRCPDRPPGVLWAEAGTQCGAPLPCPPPALAVPAAPGPAPAPAAPQPCTQSVGQCEAAARAVLEEWAADWGPFRRMMEDELATLDVLAGVRELATRAIELQERHDALLRQHHKLQDDHRLLAKRYGRLEQRAAAVAAVAQSFRVARVLGRGSYGTVVQTVPHEGAAAEAIKVPHNSDAAAHESRGARLVLRAFGRAPPPGLEALVPKGELRLGGRQCMVYPLCGGGNMYNLLLAAGKLAPSRVVQCARRLLGGLTALHAAGLVHGDVKLENLLLTSSGQPALGDAGLLRTERDCARHSGGGWGTPAYLAPEADTGPNGRGADIWALGCALWEMLEGDLTFWSEVLEQALPHSERAAWAMRRIERAPAPLRRLIGGMLRTDPARRLAAPDAAAVLR